MARTLSRVTRTVPIGGNLKMRVEDMDITNYTSGGEDFAPSDVNMRRFVWVIPVVIGSGSATTSAMTGVQPVWDEANDKIEVYHSGGADGEMAEMTGGNNEGTKLRLICIGV